VPIALALLLLTGIGPVLSWKRATASFMKRNFIIPIFVGVLATLVSIPFGLHGVYPAVCVFGAAFVISCVVMEFARGVQARKDVEAPVNPAAFVHLVQKNKRRYGGYIVHLGVVMIFVGVLGSSVFQKEAHAPLQPGQSMAIGPYALTLDKVEDTQIQNATQTRAHVQVSRNGKRLTDMHPAKAMYTKSQQPMTEVALQSTAAEDLYLILGGVNEDGSASIQAYINPLVAFVWMGGVVMVIGTIICLADRMRLKREEKLLA
jgi:cytochrome c-type biogenesis protein CcmF